MNSQKEWNIGYNKYYYYTYIKHKLLIDIIYIKKPFLLTEVVFFSDSY